MALPVTIPNAFANATASIPLSQLDTNFNTLANAVNGISDGSETLANVTATVANITTANVGALNTSGAVVFNDAGADVDFRVEGDTDANLLFVDASTDRVGIGTDTLTSRFTVNYTNSTAYTAGFRTAGVSVVNDDTTSGVSSDLYFSARGDGASGASGSISLIHTGDGDGAFSFITRNNGNPAERMRITSSGEVLVGGTTATTNSFGTVDKLAVQGGNGGSIGLFRDDTTVTNGNLIGSLTFYGNDTTSNTVTPLAYIAGVASGTHAAGNNPTDLVFGTTPGGSGTVEEQMRIGQGGHLLLNTGSFAGGSTVGFQIDATSTSGGAYAQLIRDNSDTEIFQMRCNGGLANFSANNVNLSDERVKKDIANLGSQWNCLKEWNLVEFRYKTQEENAPKNYGVIAQQIQEHCPEVVEVFQKAAEAVEAKEAVLDEEGNIIEPAVEAKPAVEERIGVREQQMLWMAVKALQEAMERIETLEAKVAALENA